MTRHDQQHSLDRASLYKPRIDHVQAILGSGKAHAHVEAVVRPGNDGVLAALPEDADWDTITAGISWNSHARVKAEKDSVEARSGDIAERAKQLHERIDDHKRYIAGRKQLHKSRREAIAAEKQRLRERRAQALEPVQADLKRVKRHLEKVHTRTADAREYLCLEVGTLCGLHRVKGSKSSFQLGGLRIPNLKDLNSLKGRLAGELLSGPEGRPISEIWDLVSASMDNICFFLAICCYYLSVRPPAEVIIPHADFPHAAVMQREASYKPGEIRYPEGGSSIQSSPAQSKNLPVIVERGKPRLLQLHKPLIVLRKQDPKTYDKFIEGVMLLAYDIAWLCRTQGVFDGTPSFDEVCDIGRNVYMLVNQRSRPTLERRTTGATKKTDTGAGTQFGRFSHASTAHSLAGYEGTAMFAPDAWKLSITTLTDKLGRYLRREASQAEWHFVEDTEWDDILAHEKPVMVGGGSMMKRPDMSVMTVAPNDGGADASDAQSGGKMKDKASSGWTKLRGRGPDDA